MKKLPLVLTLCCAFSLCSCGNSDAGAEIEIPILETDSMEYNTTVAEVTNITQSYKSTARITSPFAESVKFSQSGQIKEINVTSGMAVKEGDLLCTLRTEDLDEQIEEADVWLTQTEETLATLKASADSTATEIEYAQIDYDMQKLSCENLEKQLEAYNVYATCDGTVTYVNTSNGELNVNSPVYSGQELCTITDSSQKYLCAMVYDIALDNVNFGTKVKLYQGDNEYDGVVSQVLDMSEEGSTMFMYMISCDEVESLYDFGDTEVKFQVYEKNDVVVVPSDAVKTISDRTYVNLLVDGVKVEQDIETGIVDGDNVEVTNGLAGGEIVIIN